jgi:hypothetical protein
MRPVRRAEIEDLAARLGSGDDRTGLIVERARPLLKAIDAFGSHRVQAAAMVRAIAPP